MNQEANDAKVLKRDRTAFISSCAESGNRARRLVRLSSNLGRRLRLPIPLAILSTSQSCWFDRRDPIGHAYCHDRVAFFAGGRRPSAQCLSLKWEVARCAMRMSTDSEAWTAPDLIKDCRRSVSSGCTQSIFNCFVSLIWWRSA
jgi:hypothetical protein